MTTALAKTEGNGASNPSSLPALSQPGTPPRSAGLPRLLDWDYETAKRHCEMLAKTGLLTDTRDIGVALSKIIAGCELGIGPSLALSSLHLINGKITMSSGLISTLIKRSGKYRFRSQVDARLCAIEVYELFNGRWEQIGAETFSFEDAKAAGLTTGPNKSNWEKYPRNMLFARCISNVGKFHCSDVFGGAVYTHEEMGAVIDGETGDVLPAQPYPKAVPPSQDPDRFQAEAGASPGSAPKAAEGGKPAAGEKTVGLKAGDAKAETAPALAATKRRVADLLKETGMSKEESYGFLARKGLRGLKTAGDWTQAEAILTAHVKTLQPPDDPVLDVEFEASEEPEPFPDDPAQEDRTVEDGTAGSVSSGPVLVDTETGEMPRTREDDLADAFALEERAEADPKRRETMRKGWCKNAGVPPVAVTLMDDAQLAQYVVWLAQYTKDE